MNPLVTYQLQDGIATLAMDDGKVNALSAAMIDALNEALQRAAADRAAVLLRGRSGTFCAGFHLPSLAAGAAAAARLVSAGFEFAERLLAYPHPVVVECGGHALAMGAFLLLCGDERLGADGVYKIGANEVAIGLPMPRAAIEISRQRLAPAHFDRALITSAIYTPAEAAAAGFIDRVVAPAELEGAARQAAQRLAGLPRQAYTIAKLMLRDGALQALRAAMQADRAEFQDRLG